MTVGMVRVIVSGSYVVKAQRAQHIDDLGLLHPVVQVLRTAAEHDILLGAVIVTAVQADRVLAASNRPDATVEREIAWIVLRRRWVEIMRPNVNGVGTARYQIEQFDRIIHVIKHAASDDQIVFEIVAFEPAQEIAEVELGQAQIEHLLGDQAAQIGRDISFDSIEDRGILSLQHRGVERFEWPEFEHPFSFKVAELLNGPLDTPIIVELGLACPDSVLFWESMMPPGDEIDSILLCR